MKALACAYIQHRDMRVSRERVEQTFNCKEEPGLKERSSTSKAGLEEGRPISSEELTY